MATHGRTTEKRRCARHNTKVEAVMSVGESAPIECIILDYSEEGLFLQVKNPGHIGLKRGKNAKIYFSSHTGTTKEYFQIDATVARVSDEGIGVAFENISASMFNALKESTNIGSISAYSKNPKFYLTSTNQERFKNELKQLLNEHLPNLIRVFFDEIENSAEKKSDFAQNFDDVAAQNNVISVLRMNKVAFVTGFCKAVVENLTFTGEKADRKPVANLSDGSLSLVEKDAFEDWLNFSTSVRKINAQFKNQLYQMELKLSYVTCFPRFLIRNPIDPEHLFEHLHLEINKIEESNAAKKVVYSAFQSASAKYLPTLYQAFESLLAEHGAPTETAKDIVWKKNYPTNANTTLSGGFASGVPLSSFDSDEFYYPDANDIRQSLPEPQHRPNIYRPPVSQTVTKLFGLLNQGLSGMTPSPDPSAYLPSTSSQNPYDAGSQYSVDELLTALTKLQSTNAFQKLPADTTQLLQSQLNEATTTAGFMGSKSLSPEDKTKIDVYDQLFQALLKELMLTPSIKSYLETIKLPLMALTLQDPNFLDSDSHPAKNLLNQLSALESAIAQNKIVKNTQIKQLMDQVVGRIAQGSISNPDLFDKANEELKELSAPILKSREANIRRVIEICEGKQKLEKARVAIQQEVDGKIGGKTIPLVVKSLLDAGWQHQLVINELNGDDENKQKNLETVDNLLTWFAELGHIPDYEKDIIESELEHINRTLGNVCTNAFAHNKIMEDLKVTLLGSNNVGHNVETITAEIHPFINHRDQPPDRWNLEVEQLEVGNWFTFSIEKEAFEPLKLVWIGELPENFVFVNRDGLKKQELTRHELAELLQTGIVNRIENLDEPLMDRATTVMLQQMQEKLIHSVSHDPITNLPNRKRFVAVLKERLGSINESQHILGHLEIEDFRIISNVCGLAGGDKLLTQVAEVITHTLGPNSIVSRLGDKTFGFLLSDCPPETGQQIAQSIRDAINKSNFIWDDKSYTISVSIGLVPVLEPTRNIEELLQKADTVNISATRSGHNRIRVYQENDESLRTQMDIHEWAGRIDRIFKENRLFARCQMIAPIDPDINDHSHYEILLGVRDENGNIIPPDKFIPAVENCRRMPEIDRWNIETVFSWIKQNHKSFEKIGGFAINLSGQSLNSEEFLYYLKDRLSVQDIPAEKITFEVTETVAADSLVFTKRFIKEIKHYGCKFSLDDFGTGYSSYSYLKSLDVDYLKIDGSFIKDIANSPTDVVMVNSMNEIAHSLELETIAEYVENMKIHAILKEIGVNYAQGYGIQKPVPLTELLSTLNL